MEKVNFNLEQQTTKSKVSHDSDLDKQNTLPSYEPKVSVCYIWSLLVTKRAIITDGQMGGWMDNIVIPSSFSAWHTQEEEAKVNLKVAAELITQMQSI